MKESRFFDYIALAAFIFATLFFFACNATAQTAARNSKATHSIQFWQTYSPVNGRFKISLPMKPDVIESPVYIEGEAFDLTSYTVNSGSSTGIYQIVHLDYPITISDSEVIERGFDIGRDKLLASKPGAALLSDNTIKINGFTGRELIYEYGSLVYKIKAFIAGRRFYGMLNATPPMHNLPTQLMQIFQTESAHFFNSFEIVHNRTQTAARRTSGKRKNR